MLEKRWKYRPQPDEHRVKLLQQAINASQPLATLLVQRGITGFEDAKNFFTPSLSQLHLPLLMKGIPQAVERITRAINEGENILVYGDYDVDGTTAVALMHSFLTTHYDRVSYYLPDRYTEGYGVSFQGIDFAADNDITLIIALDCGIKAVEKVAYAKQKGIDFIICDHHLPSDGLPEAVAILNPLQAGCEYPYKHLSGCGIGFKLVQALCSAWGLEKTEPMPYLDLVAIAAACDIVPMTGENRVLCHFGLKQMEKSLRPGLALLLDNGGLMKKAQDNRLRLKRSLSVSDLVFTLGPRINAAGRMEHGKLAVELLTATTIQQAEKPAQRINQNNQERREVDMGMLDEALEMLKDAPDAKSTVLFKDTWHKGVVGIVASRIQDHYYRPTIVLCNANGKVSGSARSVRGFDVHQAIEACADLLENFGGHPAAAGLTMRSENLDAFRARFEESVAATISEEQLVPSIDLDLDLDLDQITERFFEQMSRIAPFGPENMRPTFACHGLVDTGNSRCVGDGTHLKLEVFQTKNPKRVMKGIAFGLGHHAERIKQGETFSVAFAIERNEFNGKTTLEIMVRGIRFGQ